MCNQSRPLGRCSVGPMARFQQDRHPAGPSGYAPRQRRTPNFQCRNYSRNRNAVGSAPAAGVVFRALAENPWRAKTSQRLETESRATASGSGAAGNARGGRAPQLQLSDPIKPNQTTFMPVRAAAGARRAADAVLCTFATFGSFHSAWLPGGRCKHQNYQTNPNFLERIGKVTCLGIDTYIINSRRVRLGSFGFVWGGGVSLF